MNGRDALRTAFNLKAGLVKLKAGAIGLGVFIIVMVLVGLFTGGMSGTAKADSCGGRGTPGVDDGGSAGGTPGGGPATRKEQIENAKVIDKVASDGGLSGYATLIGLMTALQESTLFNLDHGDRDSVGLFQQRPSQGWGTVDQIMQPTYAAKMFYFGDEDGSPRGMVDVRNWQNMDAGRVAQAVQRSAYPDLYAGQEDAARKIAGEAGIDLDRAGTSETPDRQNPGDDGSNGDDQADDENCYPETGGGAGKPGKPGEPFYDGAAGWPAQVKNPRTNAEAIRWAETEARTGGKDWYRKCLAFVAVAHGWNFSGVHYAIDHYKEMPPKMKHDRDRNPPPGALMYWDTGQRAGHVAVYLGDGKIASNDIRRPGYIDVVPATDIETVWGATYLGWAPPYFPKGG
ncbi:MULTISPECIES: C40 family peptidase [unclassified Streptomyces]|uniref:C40 family peptidase n=1 Tax=unclassified Streptomyces TaxID=2593676 RepID=UPI00136E00CA|nr:C40 family peptidase [Streptomyces sp. YIM 132580]MXG30380.1 peptidase M23 [Streptomyces sp. YIM 132580]